MESTTPPIIVSPEQTLLAPSEEERVREIEEHYRAGGRYIDGTPQHKTAVNLLETQDIKKFTYRQHLLRVLYRLTDPPPKQPKVQPQPSLSKSSSLPVINVPTSLHLPSEEREHHTMDTGGESGV